MRRPLEVLCPGCEVWIDAAGISATWECPHCELELEDSAFMRGGQLGELAFAIALRPAGCG